MTPGTIGDMAETLETFEFKGTSGVTSTQRYPWDMWADGKIRRVQQGVDFQLNTRDFARSVCRAARRRGLHAQTYRKGDIVVFQMLSPETTHAGGINSPRD